MKKIFVLLTLLLVACAQDEINTPVLIVEETVLGLNLDTIVTDGSTMNIGVESTGTYTLKIENLNGELLSKSKLNLEKGNNRLSFYTKSLGSQPLNIALIGPDGNKRYETKIGTQ